MRIYLSVKNFGPIKQGKILVREKGLYVLIGKNNTGKSYMLRLLYLITSTIENVLGSTFSSRNRQKVTRDAGVQIKESLLGLLQASFGKDIMEKSEGIYYRIETSRYSVVVRYPPLRVHVFLTFKYRTMITSRSYGKKLLSRDELTWIVYFPASRSGILVLFPSIIVAILRDIVEPIPEIRDFIALLHMISINLGERIIVLGERTKKESTWQENTGCLESCLAGLEKIMSGTVRVKKPDSIRFVANFNSEIDLYNTSSMCNEVIPLWLLLKYLLVRPRKNVILIYEEPEAHLHPDAQHKMAEILGSLSSMFPVIISTHSSNMIYKFNNMLRLHGHEKYAKKLGFLSTLDPEYTQAWIFKDGKIERIPVSIENGIDENVFYDIDVSLADETAQISTYLSSTQQQG